MIHRGSEDGYFRGGRRKEGGGRNVKRRDEIGEAEVGRFALLLPQTGDPFFSGRWYSHSTLLTPHSSNNNIITVAVGIEEFEESIGMIRPFQLTQHNLSLLKQTIFLCLVLHLPGKEKVRPVDIGRQFGDIVGEFHLNSTGCPI
jgi:hypothetical protein